MRFPRGGWQSCFIGALICALLTGCAAPAAEPTVTPTPSITPTPTATVVWFPATPTPTTYATQPPQPTPDQRPGLGETLLTDEFDSSSVWTTGRTTPGSASVSNHELTIALAQPRAYIASLRSQPDLTNFYVEVTTSANICSPEDSYGVLFRVASSQDFYRFSISCSGQLRLERALAGAVALVQDWTPSGQVPPGAPLKLRLGIWAVEGEMRFFVNDIYQFTARDPVLKSGKLGFFARSGGTEMVSVSFRELSVRSVSGVTILTPTQTPTVTLAPTKTPRPTRTYIPTSTPRPTQTTIPTKTPVQ